jgi:hypothetical protein
MLSKKAGEFRDGLPNRDPLFLARQLARFMFHNDVLYASGLSNCKMLEIAGNPAAGIERDTSVCGAISREERSFANGRAVTP